MFRASIVLLLQQKGNNGALEKGCRSQNDEDSESQAEDSYLGNRDANTAQSCAVESQVWGDWLSAGIQQPQTPPPTT